MTVFDNAAAELNDFGFRLSDLESRVAALEAEPVEPPPSDEPTEPPEDDVTVTEPYPASPDVVLAPGASVQPELTAGRIVELEPGDYGDQQLSPASGVYLFSRGQATFRAPATNQKRWIDSGGDNVTLRGLKADRYGTSGFHGDAAFRFPSSSSGWHLIDVEIMAAIFTCIDFRGSNHTVTRPVLHDFGRYGWHSGFDSTIKDAHVYRACIEDGSELVPRADDSNRGVCKMAGGSSGMFIDGLLMEHIDGGKGLWWDGARDGTARNIIGRNIDHNAVSVEVCWGGAQNAPDGKTTTYPEPAFVITGVDVDGQHNTNPSEVWPEPSGVSASMSPGVQVSDVLLRNCGNGIGVLYSSAHTVFNNGYPSQNITAAWAQANLDNQRVSFDNFDIDGIERYTCGFVDQGSPTFTNGEYGTNPKFRWEGDLDMSLSDWLALGHS